MSILEKMYKKKGEKYGVVNNKEEWTHREMSSILCWLNFFTIDRDNPGVFLGTFLLLNGWPEGRIGVVAFVKEIISLFFQTPMGDRIDKTTYKREYLCASDFVLALTSFTFIFYHNYGWVVFCVAIQGFFLTVVPPALYGITLGMIGSRRLAEQSGENEVYKHGGTAIRALLIGITSYYGEDYWIFLFVILSAIVAMPLVMRIKPNMIDDDKARGLVPNKHGDVASQPRAYEDVVKDPNVIILLLTVFFYHLGNAGMLPILNQYLALDHSRTGILITAMNLAIAHLLIIPSAILVGNKTETWGTKMLFQLGLILNPIRGFIVIGLIHHPEDMTAALIMTQVLNGLSEGIYFVVVVVITERLTRGSGRFSFVYGLVNTSMAVAGAFSNLISNYIAEYEGYSGAFLFLTIMSFIPVFLYGIMMPEPSTQDFPETGDTKSSHGGTALNVSNHDGTPYRDTELSYPVKSTVNSQTHEEEGEVVFRTDLTAATPDKTVSRPAPRPPVEANGVVTNPMLANSTTLSL